MNNIVIAKDGSLVLEALYQKLLAEGQNGSYLKLDANGQGSGLMPVSIELKASNGVGSAVFSVAHYYEQNGDLMADPYMEFLRIDKPSQLAPIFIPVHFQQDGMFGRDQQLVILNEDTLAPERYAKKQTADAKVFTSQWMRNINWQQQLNVKGVKASQ